MTASEATTAHLDHDIEARLLRLSTITPSDRARDAMDARVRALTAAAPAVIPVRRRRFGRRGLALGIAFAMLVVAGAGGGLQGLYQAMVGGSGVSQAQWNEATILGLSQSAHGYTVIVDRAYADANQVMLALSVVNAANQPASEVATTLATLTDNAGGSDDMIEATSLPDGGAAAANLAWFRTSAPAVAGPRTFRLQLDSISVRDLSTPPPTDDPSWDPWHDLAGPWTFEFSLDVHPGSLASPNVAATAAGVTVRLQDVRATDATIVADVAIAADPAGAAAGVQWLAGGTFEHNGASFQTIGSGPTNIETRSSTTDRAGDWTLRIDELDGLKDGQQVRLQGPWVLHFQFP